MIVVLCHYCTDFFFYIWILKKIFLLEVAIVLIEHVRGQVDVGVKTRRHGDAKPVHAAWLGREGSHAQVVAGDAVGDDGGAAVCDVAKSGERDDDYLVSEVTQEKLVGQGQLHPTQTRG